MLLVINYTTDGEKKYFKIFNLIRNILNSVPTYANSHIRFPTIKKLKLNVTITN